MKSNIHLLSKMNPITKSQLIRFIVVFFINFIATGGIITGSIYLTGLNEGAQPFTQYFAEHTQEFIFLMLSIFLIYFIFSVYFYFENHIMVTNAENMEMVFLAIELTLIFCFVFGNYLTMYIRPIIFAALILLPLTDRRSAIFINVATCIIVFLTDSYSNSTINVIVSTSNFITAFICGTIGVYLMDKMYSRIQTILRGVVLAVPAVICLVILHQRQTMDAISVVGTVTSGLLSTILMVFILPIFENIFNRITTYRLSELTRHDAPLIRKMIEVAPGTFNHSITVSNIAEACATAIGEDALLARACAYYHDVGKLKQPEYFSENQKNGVNPHDNITPELSTNIIKSHVKDGAELMRKNHMPKMFADVCLQHHGTMPILYFFDKAKKFTDGELAVENFLYYGPKPQTKIAAIIMVADSSEAAVRALPNRTRDNVDERVGKIIDERLRLGQFDECEITMRELSIIRNVIVNALSGVYHERIKYPKINLEYLVQKSEEENKARGKN